MFEIENRYLFGYLLLRIPCNGQNVYSSVYFAPNKIPFFYFEYLRIAARPILFINKSKE